MKNFLFALIALIVFAQESKALTIAQARAQGTGTVTVRGIATNGAEFGNARYIQDATGGINLYGTSLSIVNRGDSVVATGTLSLYNNLLELTVTGFNSSSILATNKPLPTPILLTPNQMAEANEAQLIRINNCVFSNGGAVFASNANYNFTSGGQTGVVRITAGDPLIGQLIPNSTVNLIGISSQFCSTPATGCTTGYQLLLRDINDIINNASIYITTQPAPANINTTTLDITWGTNIAGTNSWIKYGKTTALELGVLTATTAGTNHTATITSTPATIYYARVYSKNGVDTASSLPKTYCSKSNSTGTIKTYFTKPVNNSVSTGTNAVYLNDHVADTLAAYINRSRYTCDIAIYNWDNSHSVISTALNNAKTRGVKIRIIYDGTPPNPTGLTALNAAIKRMASPQGTGYTIMHDKFVIIDANSPNANYPVLWTGSTNWTSAQLSTDANNVIIFQDQSIARGYKLEFDEMWGDTVAGGNSNATNSKFGQYKTDNTPHEYLIGGKRVEQYMSPSDGTNIHILSTINSANTDMFFGVMEITRTDLANAIAGRVSAGVNAEGIVDDTTSASTPYFIMHNVMNANFIIDSYSYLFHHKYMIVDETNASSDPLVLTGSHNWSNAGDQKNDENTVIVHDATIANIYYQEFYQRWLDEGGTPLMLNAVVNAKDVNVFPNPNSGNFAITYNSESNLASQIRVYDISGRVVHTAQHSNNIGFNIVEVSMNNYSAGLYFVEVTNNNQKITKKIMVQ